MNINEEIKKIICEHSELDICEDEIKLDMDLVDDLGINSIAMILIIVEIEEKFDISLDGDEIDFSQITKVERLIEEVTNLIGENI